MYTNTHKIIWCVCVCVCARACLYMLVSIIHDWCMFCVYLNGFFVPTGLIYGFKGLILVFGLFLAYETRSIKVKQINDSRYVGMSIYNVVVLCLITAPVAMVIASQQDASFAFMALAVIFCCFLSMLLIFVPKVSC